MMQERGIPSQMKKAKQLELNTRAKPTMAAMKSCKSTRDIRKPFNFVEKQPVQFKQAYDSNGSSFCNANFEADAQQLLK